MRSGGGSTGKVDRSDQAGASAIEFAFVMPLLFAMLYGAITYGYAFFIQQQINYVAEQGARAAVAVTTSGAPTTNAARCAAATLAITNALSFLSPAELAAFNATPQNYCPAPPAPGAPGLNNFSVQVRFSFLTLLPAIVLPGIGNVPVLPDPLTATATVLD